MLAFNKAHLGWNWIHGVCPNQINRRSIDYGSETRSCRLPVSEVDRARAFYEKLGFRLDIDYVANEDYRAIQFTPPGSEASIIFGKGVTSTRPGSIDRLVLAVDDIDAARSELLSRGVEVSEVFHDAGEGLGGGFHAGTEARAPDPQGRSYASYASFSDPDGNIWLLQEIKERLPGRTNAKTT
jgi:catechol 2,3-dioxygenase-like lactoylglutathione lyase family enzyme